MFRSNQKFKSLKLGQQPNRSQLNKDVWQKLVPKLSKPTLPSLGSFRLPKPSRWQVLFLAVIILVGGWTYLAQHFSIKQVNLKTEHLICNSEGEIQKVINLKGKSIFSLNTTQLRQQLKSKFTCIQDVIVTKQYPATVSVMVNGRLPVAILGQVVNADDLLSYPTLEATASSHAALLNWQTQTDPNKFYYVDSTGLMFTQANGDLQLEKFYLDGSVVDLNQKIDPVILKSALLVIMQLRKDEFNILNTRIDRVNNLLVNGDATKLIFSLNRDVERQIASLHLIWQKAKMDSKQVVSLDLRFDRPVVVYLK